MNRETWRTTLHSAQRLAAGRALLSAVRSGRLVRPAVCSRCHKPSKPDHKGRAMPIQAHHADYAKPLDVEWLCRGCHVAEHQRLAKAATAARQARLRDPACRIRVAS